MAALNPELTIPSHLIVRFDDSTSKRTLKLASRWHSQVAGENGCIKVAYRVTGARYGSLGYKLFVPQIETSSSSI